MIKGVYAKVYLSERETLREFFHLANWGMNSMELKI